MIEFTRSPTTSDGKTHPNLPAAQQHALSLIIADTKDVHEILNLLVKNAPKVVAILSVKEKGRPRSKKANGVTRAPRRPKATPDTGVATG